MSAKTDELRLINGDEYDEVDNPNGLDGGMDPNFVRALGLIADVAEEVADDADALANAAAQVLPAVPVVTAARDQAVAAAQTAASLIQHVQPSEIAGIDPIIDFPFRASTAVPSGVITGSSGKWVTNQAGVLTYVPAGTAPIDFDPVTGVTRGLLVEESRTQLLTYSRDFSHASWTKSGVTVASTSVSTPFGTTAQKLVESSLAEQHFVSQTITSAATVGAKYCAWIIAKAAERSKIAITSFGEGYAVFNLTSKTVESSGGNGGGVIDLGGGWCLCWACITRTNTNGGYFWSVWGGSPAYLGDGVSGVYVCHAQLEAGTVPTSAIPTVGAAVPRAADANTITLSGIPGWNASEFTIYVEAMRPVFGSSYPWAVALDDTSAGNRVGIYHDDAGSDAVRAICRASSASQADLVGPVIAAGSMFKAAFRVQSGSFALSVNGGAAVTGSSGVVPATTRLVIGGGDQPWNGYLRRLTIFPRGISNATLALLTA